MQPIIHFLNLRYVVHLYNLQKVSNSQSKAFFFDYLVYGSADPILQDLKKIIIIKNYIFF